MLDLPPHHFARSPLSPYTTLFRSYVCDRRHNRVQVFKTDGTYVNEVFIDTDVKALWVWAAKAKKYVAFRGQGSTPARRLRGSGSVSNAALSRDPDNKYLFVGGSPS